MCMAIQVFYDINPCRVVISFGEAVFLQVMLTELRYFITWHKCHVCFKRGALCKTCCTLMSHPKQGYRKYSNLLAHDAVYIYRYLCLGGAGRLHLQHSTNLALLWCPKVGDGKFLQNVGTCMSILIYTTVTFQENTIHNVTILNTDH